MKIIFVENEQEHIRLEQLLKLEKFVIFPLFNQDSHPLLTQPIVIFAKPLLLDELFVISVSHSECIKSKFDVSLFEDSFVYNKKYFNLKNSIDIDSIYYIQNHEYTINLFKSQQDWKIYPIYKIIDGLKDIIEEFSQICFETLQKNLQNEKDIKFINDITIPVLTQLESYGIKIDETFENKELIVNGYVYSQYNYLTTTGRPSNRYGGVNYGALNKNDGSRMPFISRFEEGQLIMFDYDSYHLRLIARLIGHELPVGSVHSYFAKQYFRLKETDIVTDEMYEESKKISFKLLYGGITKEYEHVDFFRDTQKLIDELWKSHNEYGYISSVVSGIKISADNKMKLFNYLIQNYETEQNMVVLRKILLSIQEFKSVPILYTYDSILFDVHPDEIVKLIPKITEIMEINSKFPIKISYGKNYHEMKKM